MTRLVLAGEPAADASKGAGAMSWDEALVDAGVLQPGESLDSSGRVVLVVREQLDHLNALYCRAVLDLETFDDFDSFVTAAVDSGRHDLAELLHLLDGPAGQAVAVPFSKVPAGPPTPGPVLVGATRLLHKRLTRLGAIQGERVAAAAAAAGSLRHRAADHDWDDTTSWGWSRASATTTAQRFRPGNARFAQRAWGTGWPDPPPERERTRFDLAGLRPALVSDVLTTIQEAVDAC